MGQPKLIVRKPLAPSCPQAWRRTRPLGQPFATHCNQWDAEVKPIEKDPSKKGFVPIRCTDMADTTFAINTKSVPVMQHASLAQVSGRNGLFRMAVSFLVY